MSEEKIEVRLAALEKVLGLLGNIRIPLEDISDVQIVENPLRDVMRAGLKVGLRLPWLYYVCRTIRLDQAWAVRRGVPALSFAISNEGALERVTVSTPDARELAQRLRELRSQTANRPASPETPSGVSPGSPETRQM